MLGIPETDKIVTSELWIFTYKAGLLQGILTNDENLIPWMIPVSP